MNRPIPTKRQALYDYDTSRAAHNQQKSRDPRAALTPVMVTSVGRKYFSCTVQGFPIGKTHTTLYNLSDWSQCTDTVPTHQLFVSPDDYANLIEERTIWRTLREVFSCGGINTRRIPLANLREILRLVQK
jgi:hypothetical protein